MLIGALAGGDQISGPVWVPSAPPSLENYLAPTLQPIPLLPAIAVLMGAFLQNGLTPGPLLFTQEAPVRPLTNPTATPRQD